MVVETVLLQVPLEKLYTTVYVPSALVAKLISPVAAFSDSPAVELKVPPPTPVRLTIAVPLVQYGLAV